MKKALYSIFVLVWVIGIHLCQAQTPVKVSDPRLEIKGNKLVISYDILEREPGAKFIVNVVVLGEDGKTIQASSLKGDVGEEITGGNNKQVTWDYEADNVFINAYITIQIQASIVPPPTPPPVIVIKEEKEDPVEETKANEQPTGAQETKSINRTGLILQSVAFPGLGLTKVTGKPHWIKGVAGYGCIAGSVFMNRKAISTYNSIRDLDTDADVTDAYNKSVQQDNVSEILAYTAIGIWITDLIWTLVGTSSLTGSPSYAYSKGLSLKSDIDPVSHVPQLGIIYRF